MFQSLYMHGTQLLLPAGTPGEPLEILMPGPLPGQIHSESLERAQVTQMNSEA